MCPLLQMFKKILVDKNPESDLLEFSCVEYWGLDKGQR